MTKPKIAIANVERPARVAQVVELAAAYPLHLLRLGVPTKNGNATMVGNAPFDNLRASESKVSP